MIFRHAYKGTTWIDLAQPTPAEIHQIAKEFGIHERIETELLTPSPLPVVASEPTALLLVLHFPAYGANEGVRDQEIDLVVGRHFVITTRTEVVTSLEKLRRLLEAEQLLGSQGNLTNDALLEIVMAHLYAGVRDYTNHMATRINYVERDMFSGKERETVHHISQINRDYLHLEASVANQEEPLERFLKLLERRDLFGTTFPERAARIAAERSQVARLLSTHRAVATELRETNTALLGARQNEIMKTLTVITFIMLPLTLIASVFQIGAQDTPLLASPHAFWIILGLMLAMAGLLTLFFTRKRWL